MSEWPPEDVTDVLTIVAARLTHLTRHRLRHLEPTLTYRQYRLMSHIRGGATSLTRLRAHTVISMSALSETIDTMARKGLVSRTPSATDGRGVDLALTDDGEATVTAARRLLAELATEVIAEVPEHARSGLVAALATMDEAAAGLLSAEHNTPIPRAFRHHAPEPEESEGSG